MQIELVHIFIKVVRMGGFSKAANALKIPKSTVSKAVSRLESTTGTKLLVRTTRSQTLTAAGKAFYDSCVGPLQAIEDAQKSLIGSDSLITGTIKLTAPEDLGTEVLAPAVSKLLQDHPGLNFEFVYTDEVVDLVKDGFDLAVRIGVLKESGLKAKRIGDVTLILVASPDYLKKHSPIQKPDHLKQHRCLTLSVGGKSSEWRLRSNTSSITVPIQPRISSNQMSSLIHAALADGGIALVPSFLARSWIEAGKLVHVLPKWRSMGFPVSIVSPLPFSSSARLRMTTDYFIEQIRAAL